MEQIKYRTVQTEDYIAVLLEDGGYANIHYAEAYEFEPNRQATTEYYGRKFTLEDLQSDTDLYEVLGEGKMYYNDWDTPFTDPAHLRDALEWLAPGYTYILDETIWKDYGNSDSMSSSSHGAGRVL